MTHQEILEIAISKAIAGGWKYHVWLEPVTRSLQEKLKHSTSKQSWIAIIMDEYENQPYQLIFNHEFAKALWGEELVKEAYRLDKGKNKGEVLVREPERPIWQCILRSMVIADDPIKYLGDNIPSDK